MRNSTSAVLLRNTIFTGIVPVYKFDIPNHPIQSMRGWHRTSELFAAITKIQIGMQLYPMTAKEIEKEFPHLNPIRILAPWSRYILGQPAYYHIINYSGHLEKVFTGEKWFEKTAHSEVYLPARLGNKIIWATKNPLPSMARRNLCLLLDSMLGRAPTKAS